MFISFCFHLDVIDRCASNPCKNGGICFNMGTTYICQCRKLGNKVFDGKNCERGTHYCFGIINAYKLYNNGKSVIIN